ncbi:MAG TPA: glycosyltransferase [Candidatus Dormibacteraeota bacterium]|nr:glycosyltransferase [Candidatus Dormibacteraeota bacterium]
MELPSTCNTLLMLISVVVPTRNRPADVARLLPTIGAQTRLPDQLVVVDQGADDSTESASRAVMGTQLDERCTYIRDSGIRGASAARNVGISHATGDVVVFLDDDVLLSPDCLAELERAFLVNPDYAGIGGVELQMEEAKRSYILYYDLFFVGPFRDRKYAISRNWRRLRGVQPVTALKTCLAGFRRDFLARNRFDERWRSALLEDVELCWRVRGRERFGIWPQASAWHSISESRTGGRAGYRATGAAWIFFLKSVFRRQWPVLPFYLWLWVGLWVNAARRCIVTRSLDPGIGLFEGGLSLFYPSLATPFIDSTAVAFPENTAYAVERS